MDTIAILLAAARASLACVLLIAASGKLFHHPALLQTLADFNIPAALRQPLARLMPLLELMIAVALIPATSAWWGALAGAALLGSYTAVLAYKLARGEHPGCHCFGQLEAQPIDTRTILRNGVLLALAGGLVYAGPGYRHPTILAYVLDAPALSVCAAAIAMQWWLLLRLMRQNGSLLLQMDAFDLRLSAAGIQPLAQAGRPPQGLMVGSVAPEFTLPELGGSRTTSLAGLRSPGRPVLLIFSDAGCAPCKDLMPYVDGWHAKFRHAVTIAVITRSDLRQTQRPRPAGACLTLLQADREVAASYQAQATPSAVLVTAVGTVASHLALGSKEIYDLLESALSEHDDKREIAA